jgi:hypothetical protein
MLRKSSRLREEPSLPQPYTLSELPTLPKLRSDRLLPSEIVSKILIELPKFVQPYSDIGLPNFMNMRIDRELPK